MSYTSDRRMKNLFRDIHNEALKKLEEYGLADHLKLRIFEESAEDTKLWSEGGLTFTEPISGYEFGSNDCGWYYENGNEKIPLVIVEGTFGTERGQFGDGQNNRFSHALGVAKNGYVGVLFTPFRGESYSKLEEGDKYCTIKNCNVRRPIIQAAIRVCNIEPGMYFVIDAYNAELLINLIVVELINVFGKVDGRNEVYNKILDEMKREIQGFKGRGDQALKKCFDENKREIKKFSRFFTQNLEALTTSQKRDGHGLFGKILLESYLTDLNQLCIFIRLTYKDIDILKEKKSKEITYIFNNYKCVCIDDLVFSNGLTQLKTKLYGIIGNNLHDKSEKELLTELKKYLESGEILIKMNEG